MIKLAWTFDEQNKTWETEVLAKDHSGKGKYLISLLPRPSYCDRGRWQLLIREIGVCSLDTQEEMNRYYFRLETAKQEIEDWVNNRDTCLAANV